MAFFLLLALLVGVAELKVVEVDSPKAAQKRDSVCYGSLGCFSDDPPFTSSQRPNPELPQSPDQIQTSLLLFTRDNHDNVERLDPRDTSKLSANWPSFKKRPTKVIIHGFLDDPGISTWFESMKDELLKNGDYNVVIVDWSKGNLPPYGQASANTRTVGAQVAAVIKVLMSTYGLTPDKFHLIGHSLGAHTVGYAGERIPGLGRITGLDPAGPDFADTDKVVRLDPSDAVFVDVIHTDATNLLFLGFGMIEQVGHSDFYPNLGHDQPGCTRDPITNVIEEGLINGLEDEVACNHLRSIKYFIESINTQCPFLGVPCSGENAYKSGQCKSCTSAGCAKMGFHADQHIPPNGQSVKYYLTTAGQPPFCKYSLDVTVKLSDDDGDTERGTLSVVVNGNSGSSGKIKLTSDPADYSPGQTYNFNILVPNDVGSVQSVTFSWDHDSTLLDPLHWNILGLRHPKLYLDEIDIYREEDGATVHLCSSSQSVETDQSLTVSSKC